MQIKQKSTNKKNNNNKRTQNNKSNSVLPTKKLLRGRKLFILHSFAFFFAQVLFVNKISRLEIVSKASNIILLILQFYNISQFPLCTKKELGNAFTRMVNYMEFIKSKGLMKTFIISKLS